MYSIIPYKGFKEFDIAKSIKISTLSWTGDLIQINDDRMKKRKRKDERTT
jgi:hypothetical protein